VQWKIGLKLLLTNKLFLFSLLWLTLLGCKEEFPTYASSVTTPSRTFKCLNYIGLKHTDKQKLEDAFGIKEDTHCPYVVTLTRYYVGECDNPVVKSIGGDFNGYVRAEVKKGFKCYYKVQSDFKHDANGAFERVLKRVKIDLNQEKNSN